MRSVSVNDALVLDETVLPHLKQNGDVDQALAAALAAAWENSSLSLSPNDTNTYNFKEYYTAMIGELGTYGDDIWFQCDKLTAVTSYRRQPETECDRCFFG